MAKKTAIERIERLRDELANILDSQAICISKMAQRQRQTERVLEMMMTAMDSITTCQNLMLRWTAIIERHLEIVHRDLQYASARR